MMDNTQPQKDTSPPKTTGFWQLTSYWRDRALKAEEDLATLTAAVVERPDPKPYAPPVPSWLEGRV